MKTSNIAIIGFFVVLILLSGCSNTVQVDNSNVEKTVIKEESKDLVSILKNSGLNKSEIAPPAAPGGQ